MSRYIVKGNDAVWPPNYLSGQSYPTPQAWNEPAVSTGLLDQNGKKILRVGDVIGFKLPHRKGQRP